MNAAEAGTKAKRLIAAAMLFAGALAVASRATTGQWWDAKVFPPTGRWILDIRGVEGEPIVGAELTVLPNRPCPFRQPQRGAPLSPEELFDNYAGPGSLRSDENGSLVLVNEISSSYHGRCWRLFWIVPIGETGPPVFQLMISAPGYVPATVDSDAVFYSEGPLTLILSRDPAATSPRPTPAPPSAASTW